MNTTDRMKLKAPCPAFGGKGPCMMVRGDTRDLPLADRSIHAVVKRRLTRAGAAACPGGSLASFAAALSAVPPAGPTPPEPSTRERPYKSMTDLPAGEIDAILRATVRQLGRTRRDDLIRAAAVGLGFQRTGTIIRRTIGSRLEHLVAADNVAADGDYVEIACD